MRRQLTTAFLIAAVTLALVPLVTLGGVWSTLLGRTVQDLGHLPHFGLVATLLLLIVASPRFSR